MAHTDLAKHPIVDDRAKITPEPELQARFTSFSERVSREATPELFEREASRYAEAGSKGGEVGRDIGAKIGAVRRAFIEADTGGDDKDRKQASGKTIARWLATDMDQHALARSAMEEGRYIKAVHKDGNSETGVILSHDDPKRVGMWLSKDEKGNIRQIASFNAEGNAHGAVWNYEPAEDGRRRPVSRGWMMDGQRHGDFFEYNKKGEITHHQVYEQGVLKKDSPVDPAEAAARRAEEKAHFQISRGMRIG
jgi:hypothetical protein